MIIEYNILRMKLWITFCKVFTFFAALSNGAGMYFLRISEYGDKQAGEASKKASSLLGNRTV
jgi:hypothetical protein